MAAECVKVIVRCRPINERERNLKCKIVLFTDLHRAQCSIHHPSDENAPPKVFTFDGAYYITSTTEQIYNEIALPLVEGVTEGYNGTIFAYGQTGCGKSFTMQGITEPATQRGIIPRAYMYRIFTVLLHSQLEPQKDLITTTRHSMVRNKTAVIFWVNTQHNLGYAFRPKAFDHIFESISISEKTKFLIHASYLEIYNEEIRDLLRKDHKTKLDLKEHPEKGVYVQGLSMHPVHNVVECEKIMDKGWRNRATGATLMNAESSRSHSIFTILLEMVSIDKDAEKHIRAGKLNLVDLAGSERQAKTGSTGDRLKEATKINLSLSALGNVISALVDGKSKHIPYRDSKLTRLLQDSLGGNTKTLMIACLSPADNNYDETLSTLRYANRAKNIKNKPKINEDPKDALLRQYQEEIEQLRAMIKGQLSLSADILHNEEAQPNREELEMEKSALNKEYEMKFNEIRAKYEEEKSNRTKLQEDMIKLREFYDEKLSSVDGQLANLPPTDIEAQHQKYEGEGQQPVIAVLSTEQTQSSAGDSEVLEQRDTALENLCFESQGKREHDLSFYPSTLPVAQRAVHLGTMKADVEEGPPSSRLADNQSKLHQQALERLQVLQQQMVGGENKDNQELKDRRQKKLKISEERKIKLAEAIANMDDDYIMLNIYDNIQDELRAKTKQLERENQKVTTLDREILDLQSEFELDRKDYLDTIRKQENQMQLLQSIIERIQPFIRKDSNYSNLDKIKLESKWDEENLKWILPKLVIEKTTLPATGNPVTTKGAEGRHYLNSNGNIGNNNTCGEVVDDKLRDKLWNHDNVADTYFQPRRSNHLLSGDSGSRLSMSQIKETYGVQQTLSSSSPYDDNSSQELRAAQVHGQMMLDDGLHRKPMRLESLQSTSGKKPRKKKT